MLDRCQENHGAIPGIHDLINRAYMRDGQGNSITYGYDANNQFATIVRLGTTAFEYDEQNPGTHTLIPGGIPGTSMRKLAVSSGQGAYLLVARGALGHPSWDGGIRDKRLSFGPGGT